ncbi:MAG: site-specific DNA-methyltransferase [Bacteroidetes bacterium]|nr:site-specific DNA-methyltransferase [Bacteroidota bacterium]
MMNKLYYGDNLEVLRKYIKDESIDLCYIDPPFNSKRNYNQIYNNIGKEDKAQAQAFVDTWTWDTEADKGMAEIISNYNGVFTKQSIKLITGLEGVLGKGSLLAYLVSMTLRIAEIQRVLKPTGSFYFHCDPTASHYLKIIIDAIFCAKGGDYKNEISWRRHYSHNDGNKFGCIHDIILFFTKSNEYTFNRQILPYDEDYIKKNYASIDNKSGKRFRSVSVNAAGHGEAKYFGEKLLKPPPGTHWRWNQERINEAIKEGIIYFTSNGVPRYKQFLENVEGITVQDTWVDFYSLSSHDKERLGYPTQKPEALLERIIKASTNEGDTVLDAYCGCGTTVAVSQRLNRNWVGIDITYQSVSLILKRLEDSYGKAAIDNITLNGVPEDMESAIALANKADDRIRKEFEKWVVLTYTNNMAMINEKKGGDGGIDGTAFMKDYNEKNEPINKEVLFSVKSNKTLAPSVIRDLNGTMEREGAALGILLTLYPMPNLVKECKKYGTYENKVMGTSMPKIEVVSVQEILDGKKMNLPLPVEVLKKAEAKKETGQGKLEF